MIIEKTEIRKWCSFMWQENELTNRLKIAYPIIQAPMAGGVTTSSLVAAVSNHGGLGMVGAGYMRPKELRKQIRAIKQLTDNPFGVNLFVPEKPHVKEESVKKAYDLLQPLREELEMKGGIPHVDHEENVKTFQEQLQVVSAEKVSVCSFTFGMPSKEIIQALKKENIVVIGTATTVNEALLYEQQGVDAIVVQGSEAGGHRGTFAGNVEESMIGLMALIPQVVDQIDLPVIASGGIMDARGVVASLFLGAQGIQMGTAFLTTEESGAHERHKEAILHAVEDETVLTSVFSGKHARGIKNEFIDLMKEHEATIPAYPLQNTLTKEIRKEAGKRNKSDWMSLWCGQNPRLSKKQTVAQLMSTIVSDVNKLLEYK